MLLLLLSSSSSYFWRIFVIGYFLIFQDGVVQSSRILGIFPMRSKSHYAVARKIMTTLATGRGHRVTVISGFREKSNIPNFTHIDITDQLPSFEDTVDISEDVEISLSSLLEEFKQIEVDLCETVLSDKRLKQLVALSSSSESDRFKYDLLIAENYFVPCFLALAEKLDVPIILYSAASTTKMHDYLTGNMFFSPIESASIVNGHLMNPNFLQRIRLLYEQTLSYLFCVSVSSENLALDIFNKLYTEQIITARQIQTRANVVFSCDHYIMSPKPNVPTVVELAGLHIEDVKPLPEHIRKFIDEAEHGVLYASFGTSLKLSSLPEKKLNVFLDTFRRIPQRVIWRGDIVNVTNLPSNVMIGYWFPQQDILAHENVRAFISHGGLHGTYEAIHNGVPVVGIPFLYDQVSNIRTLENRGGAIYVDRRLDLTSDRLVGVINEIVNNTRYKNKMMELSAIFRDRPMSQLDTAIYWAEYVIRHKGAHHVRSKAADMPLYQLLLLDILAFLLIACVLCSFLVYVICRKIISLFKIVPSKIKN